MSGLLGGLITMGIAWLLRGQAAKRAGDRPLAEILAEYRWHLRFSRAFFVGSLLLCIFVLSRGWAASNDWRILCLAFGVGGLGPFYAMYLGLPRRRFAEFWVAAAADEGMPVWVNTVGICICAMLLAAALAGYVFGKGY